ncbi:MAG: hypothetical protein ACLFUE_08535 [Desulfobacteraceae bacterium]
MGEIRIYVNERPLSVEQGTSVGIAAHHQVSKLVLREEIGARWAAAGLMLVGVFLLYLGSY